MAKTKAKRVPYRDFNPRDRYSIETWRKVKSLFNQGFKRAQIEDQMKIKLHKRTFNQNMKKNYDVPDVNSRKLNRSNKRTDCTVINDFERDLVRLFNTKNRHGAFGYFFLSLSAEQTRKEEKYKTNEKIQSLQFTYTWAKRVAINFDLFMTARKSDKKFFTPIEEENIRQGLMLKLAGVKPQNVINCDESPIYRNLTSALALRQKGDGYKIEMSKSRITILPWVGFHTDRQVAPCLVVHSQGSTFDLKQRVPQTVRVKIDNTIREVKRFKCLTKTGFEFYLYYNSKAYVYTDIFHAEGKRVSAYLRQKYPGTIFTTLLDNASMHVKIQNFSNLKFCFLQPGTTSIIQPLDLCWNAVLKQKYKKKLSMK